jgi:hypothetical protein
LIFSTSNLSFALLDFWELDSIYSRVTDIGISGGSLLPSSSPKCISLYSNRASPGLF